MSETQATIVATPPAAAPVPEASPAAVDAAATPPASAPVASASEGMAAPASVPTSEPSEAPSDNLAPTVLGDAIKPPETAPSTEPEKGQEGEPTNVEGQSEEPAPPPAYEAFTLPEGFQASTERMSAFTDLLGGFETLTKADHAAVQSFGQQLVDAHVTEMNRFAAEMSQRFNTHVAEVRNQWKEAFLADPEIGGNRLQTTLDEALRVLRVYGGTEDEQMAFRKFADDTGVGNHPALIRLLSRIGRGLQEGSQPPPMKAPVVQKKLSAVEKMYGRNG